MAGKLLEMKRNAGEVHVGDPILIVEDCRENGNATGQIGQYEGEFPKTVLICWQGHKREYFIEDFMEGKVMIQGRPVYEVIPPFELTDGKEGWGAIDNPRILLPDGSHIWGMECWWKAIEPGEQVDLAEAQKSLAKVKTMFAEEIKQVIADE